MFSRLGVLVFLVLGATLATACAGAPPAAPTVVPTSTPAPAAEPSPTPEELLLGAPPPDVMAGNWAGQADNGAAFLFVITHEGGKGKLTGTFTYTPAGEPDITVPIVQGRIEGRDVTLSAQVGSVMYNFVLRLGEHRSALTGTWTTADTGIPQPITFNKLAM
ncbi:MAG: hypothetical protein KKA73_03535 [Chloroflexi bacterium]|nr:hypothetical protein [Chloroflexota bacterium]MBU1878445.1 hypothetical protein [Chloroflexota bacterium]